MKSLALAVAEILHGVYNSKMCHMAVNTPLLGWLDVSRLGLASVDLQTKFEVSNYTHYEDMRSGAKCTNWGSLGQLMGYSKSSAMSPFDRAHTTSYSTLLETMRLSCTVFEIQPVICRKSPILTHPT